jgi:hypothetical protein
LPGLPAFALLLAELLIAYKGSPSCRKHDWLGISMALVTPIVFSIGVLFLPPNLVAKKTQKAIVSHYLDARPAPTSRLIYMGSRPYSAEFYSLGAAQIAATPEEIRNYLCNNQKNFFIARKSTLVNLPQDIKAGLAQVGVYGEWQLFVSTSCKGGIPKKAAGK